MEKDIQQKYDQLSENIVQSTLDIVKDVEAILYIGSFGKKEMSYVRKDDNTIEFLNDCDVMIITKEKMGSDLIKHLRDLLSKKINKEYLDFENAVSQDKYYNFYVDPRNIILEDLKRITPRIKYYDIFNNPKILYIRDSSLESIFPKIDICKIPKEDGLVHIFNRMAILVEYSPRLIEDSNILLMFVAKVYSAILEGLLLFDGNYVSSYRKMAEEFQRTYPLHIELYDILPDLDKRASHFIDIKTNFNSYFNKYSMQEIISMWEQARIDIIYTLIYLVNRIYGKHFIFKIDYENIVQIDEFLRSNERFIIYPYVKDKNFLKPVPMKIIQILINLKFFNKFESPIFSIAKSFKLKTDITSYLYCATLLSLSSLSYKSQGDDFKNNKLYIAACERLTDMISSQANKIENIDDFVKLYATIFRRWEAFVFEL